MRRSILRAAALAAVMVTGLPAEAQPQPGPRRDAIRIGILSDLSGSFADVAGPGSVVAAQLAAEDFGGRAANLPVQIVSGDHQNRADTGSAIARRWFDTEGVDAIIDLPNSAVALAVGEVARNTNRVAIPTAAVASRRSGDTENVARKPAHAPSCVSSVRTPVAGTSGRVEANERRWLPHASIRSPTISSSQCARRPSLKRR